MDKRWFLALSAVVLALPGCALFLIGGGAAAGAGAVVYSRGQLHSVQEAPFERAWDAAQDAMRDLGFVVTYQEKEPDSAKLLARTQDNEEVEIRLEAKSTTATEIRIRVGWLGNEALSNVILDKIKKHL